MNDALLDALASVLQVMKYANKKNVNMCIWPSDIVAVEAAFVAIKEQNDTLATKSVPAPRSDPNHLSFPERSVPTNAQWQAKIST